MFSDGNVDIFIFCTVPLFFGDTTYRVQFQKEVVSDFKRENWLFSKKYGKSIIFQDDSCHLIDICFTITVPVYGLHINLHTLNFPNISRLNYLSRYMLVNVSWDKLLLQMIITVYFCTPLYRYCTVLYTVVLQNYTGTVPY
jgi:hypothetical protein